MSKTIHAEVFDKVCDVLDTVHHVRHIDWDLHVPVVLRAYRTMCKTLTTKALPKLKYEVGAVILIEHVKTSLCIEAPIDMIVCEARNEGITQP